MSFSFERIRREQQEAEAAAQKRELEKQKQERRKIEELANANSLFRKSVSYYNKSLIPQLMRELSLFLKKQGERTFEFYPSTPPTSKEPVYYKEEWLVNTGHGMWWDIRSPHWRKSMSTLFTPDGTLRITAAPEATREFAYTQWYNNRHLQEHAFENAVNHPDHPPESAWGQYEGYNPTPGER